MSNEIGGRADKAGNMYEIKYFIYILLEVIEEKIRSVTLEALGNDEIATDIWIEKMNGTRESRQCKNRYRSNDNWDFSAINKYKIFEKWKYHLDREANCCVSLVSPISFSSLEDLIKRAKNTNENPMDFYEYQIQKSDKKMQELYDKYCENMGLNIKRVEDIKRSIDYLRRTDYHQVPDGELRAIIYDKIEKLFIGKVEIIYDYFVDLVIDGNIWAKKIDVMYLEKFVKSKNIMFRDLVRDERILPRIKELNDEYNKYFLPIDNKLIEREEFIECKNLIEEGKSIIIHGKAGYGKSGVTQLILKYCEDNEIAHIAIKLDKRIPHSNIEMWSEELGFSASLGLCLDSISRNRKAVIILDQLDALRWTQMHSKDALLVCTELINQVKRINYERENKISIIFVCRTYDLENDNSIKLLFKEENDKKIWRKVNVEKLSENTLKVLIGEEYNNFSVKLKDILKIPSNLYIWKKLDKNQQYNDCYTTSMLIQKWWEQLLEKSSESKVTEKELQECKEKIVIQLEKNGKTSIFKKVLNTTESSFNYLYSNGFLNMDKNMVSFTHQSLSDYFFEESMLIKYNNGSSIEEIIGDKDKQIPSKRYQVQMLLEDLANSSTKDFIDFGKQLLKSGNVRFYIKYVFFEVLGQIIDIDNEIEKFILEYYNNSQYSIYILNNVIFCHLQYVKILIRNGILDEWMEDSQKKVLCLNLLNSIKEKYSVEEVEFIKRYLFYSEDNDKKIYKNCFNFNINDDLDEMFELRMKLYEKYPELSNEYINFIEMLKSKELRAIKLIKFWLNNKIKNNRIYKYEEDLITETSEIIVNNDEKIIELLLPCIPIDIEKGWCCKYIHSNGLERTCIELIKKANVNLIKRNPKRFIEIYKEYMGKGYKLFNEIILDGLEKMPIKYSNYIINYLSSNLQKNIFEETSGNGDELLLTKNILKNHTINCSEEVFRNLEKKLYYYQEENAVDMYRRIRKKKWNYIYKKMSWDWWGNIQVELLPCLPYERLCNDTQQLIKCLNRKFIGGSSYYHYFGVQSGNISSPIWGKKLSNKQWVRLFSNKKLKNMEIHDWKSEKNGFWIESSLEGFVHDFSYAVENEPERMINLVLDNKDIILNEFVNALYNGLQICKTINEVSIELLEKVFITFPYNYESRRASDICGIIYQKNTNGWSKYTLNMLKDIAINYVGDDVEKNILAFEQNEEMKSIENLIGIAINCTRGQAAMAIGRILWKENDKFEQFKTTINCLTEDANLIIRFASLNCLLPTYNISKEWAREKILRLFEKDIRLVAFDNARDVLFLSYETEKDSVLRIIEACYNSDDKELKEIGSYCVVEMYILKDEFIDIINNIKLMDETQVVAISHMAINYFNNEIYNEKIKTILNKFEETGCDIEDSICRLFYDNLINLNRDKEFLINIMKSENGRRSIHAFIHYIDENGVSILDFKEIIISIVDSILENKVEEIEYYYGDEISKLIIELYDETVGKEDYEIKQLSNKCLDIWDEMFEKQIGAIRKLSKDILDR